jgi:type IV pilus assembly protein PilA
MFKSKYPIFKCFQKHQKGFTLIELLVVIAILGVIAAVAVPNITKFMGSGETEAAEAEMHNVIVAISAAMSEDANHACGTYSDHVVGPSESSSGSGTNPGLYLINTTAWKYTITTNGTCTQGAKA